MGGVSPHARRKTFVYMGILYADARRCCRAARCRLQRIARICSPTPWPASRRRQRCLNTCVRCTPCSSDSPLRTKPRRSSWPCSNRSTPVYAMDPTTAAWVLFQTGCMVRESPPATAVGDQVAVRQTQAMQSWRDHHRASRFNVPRAVLDDLEQPVARFRGAPAIDCR